MLLSDRHTYVLKHSLDGSLNDLARCSQPDAMMLHNKRAEAIEVHPRVVP